MVVINFKGDKELGKQICEALVGNKAFIENDIVVNYTAANGDIYIVLGESNANNVELKGELKPRTL